MKQLTFPNGRDYFALDELTAFYIYNEIYNENVYLKHGLSLPQRSTVVDVGANIGLFSLYIAESYPGASIIAIEPVPQIFEVLEANMAGFGDRARLYRSGLSDTPGKCGMTYYPKVSGDSSRVPFKWQEKVDGYLRNYRETIGKTHPHARLVPPFLRRLVVEWGLRSAYQGEKVMCDFTTLSDIIRENGLERIDLLKIDAENAEREVITGIEDKDWGIIRQIAMEVHEHIEGGENISEEMTDLLTSKGFRVTVDKGDVRADMGVFMMYAKR